MVHQRKHLRCSCKGKIFKAGKGINKQVLREGMIAELGAVNQYERLAAAAPNKNVKKVFASVIKEEKTHMGEFQTMLLKEDKEQARELFKAKKEVSGTIRYSAGKYKTHSKCEWCGKKLTNKNLYSFTGYENMVGPICKECVSPPGYKPKSLWNKPGPGTVGSESINLQDEEVDILKREYKNDLKKGTVALTGNELWVWEKDKRHWMDNLGIIYDEFEEQEEEE